MGQLKVFAEYGLVGLTLFLLMTVIVIFLKNSKKRDDSTNKQAEKLIDIFADSMTKDIEKLVESIKCLVDAVHSTQVENKQLLIEIKSDRSNTRDLFDRILSAINKQDTRIDIIYDYVRDTRKDVEK